MWTDDCFTSLSAPPPNGQTLWTYFLCGQRTTIIPGVVLASIPTVAHDLGWSLEGTAKAFREVFAKGLAEASPKHGLILLRKSLLDGDGKPRETAKPASPNVLKSWASVWDEIPDCDLKNVLLQRIKAFAEALHEGFLKAFNEAFAKPLAKALRIQDTGTGTGTVNREQEATSKDKEESKAPSAAPTALVFAHWQKVCNHPQARLGSDRERKIIARLKDGYTVEQLCMAVDGVKLSPHHRGENETHTVYDDLELICRDSGHVDRFLGLALKAAAGTGNGAEALTPAGRKAAAAAKAWLDSVPPERADA